jgi:hypothetical protein
MASSSVRTAASASRDRLSGDILAFAEPSKVGDELTGNVSYGSKRKDRFLPSNCHWARYTANCWFYITWLFGEFVDLPHDDLSEKVPTVKINMPNPSRLWAFARSIYNLWRQRDARQCFSCDNDSLHQSALVRKIKRFMPPPCFASWSRAT